MIKLIASDMDGTLLNSEHKISQGNLEAIEKAQEMGVHFAIATGRIYSDVKPFLQEHGLECECLVMNGAEYRDKNGDVLESVYIDKNKVSEIINMIKQNEISSEIYTNKGLYTIDTKEKVLIQIAYRIQVFNPGVSFEEALIMAKDHNHFTDLHYITDVNEFLNSDVEVGKFVTFYNNEETTKEVKRKLEVINGLAITSTFTKNIEINNIDAQKGIILTKVAQKMGISKEEVMVIGDSFNDYSMYTEFPVSFAMENAVPEIKEIAKYITDTNDKDGVAKAIYKVLNLS